MCALYDGNTTLVAARVWAKVGVVSPSVSMAEMSARDCTHILQIHLYQTMRYAEKQDKLCIGLLSPVAFDMQENCDYGIITEVAFREKILEVYSKKTVNKGDIEIEKETDCLINYIKEEAGFLREIGEDERGVGQFSFIHLTFQEYFAAIKMASKWQMGMDVEEFKGYVLAPHWSEVIVLTAEYLYMMGSDPELGSELASRFVRQILEIKDSIEERDRPVQLIIRILHSGIVLNNELLQKIFDTILDSGKYLHYTDLPTNGDVRDLFINTLVHRYLSSPEDDRISNLMMNMSGELKIQEALISILEGENIKAQKKLFCYRTVYPVAPITRTDIFRSSITKFVNSNEMKVTNYIPTQYTLSYVNDDNYSATSQQVMQAVKAIDRPELRQKYAEEVFREVLWGGTAELKTFSLLIKSELPDVNCDKMDRYIKKAEFAQNLNLETQGAIKIIEFNNEYSFHFSKEKNCLIFSTGNKIHLYNAPFIVTYSGIPEIDNIDEFNKFLSLVIEYVKEGKLSFENLEVFDLFVKYYDLLFWEVQSCFTDLFDYFFTHVELTVENIRKYEKIFNHHWNHKLYKKANNSEIIAFIIRSELTPAEKISVLSYMEISRKYLKDVRTIVAEYMNKNSNHNLATYHAAYELMQRV